MAVLLRTRCNAGVIIIWAVAELGQYAELHRATVRIVLRAQHTFRSWFQRR